MGSTVRIIGNSIKYIEDYGSAVMLFLMVALVFFQVLARYVFYISPIGPEELARYLMLWMAFLVAGGAVRSGEHITIDLVPLVIRNKVTLKNIRIILDMIGLVAVSILFYFGLKYLLYSLKTGETSTGLQFPLWFSTSCVFAGSLLMTLNYLVKVIKHFRRWFSPSKERSNGGSN